MAKAKRMSDIFASSAENSGTAATMTATPPYSSEGPTLPIIGGEGEHRAKLNSNGANARTSQNQSNGNARKKRKTQGPSQDGIAAKQAQPIATVHPALYEPWSLLPHELLNPLKLQARLRGTENIVPIVLTKNQNVKAAINRLKAYLGAYNDKQNPAAKQGALEQADVVIAVSAQGDGTCKLVSIVDVAQRVVAPSARETEVAKTTNTWWMYTSLTSVEVEKKTKTMLKDKVDAQPSQDAQEEEEAFEPMDVDVLAQEEMQEQRRIMKTPVLTVWMTKKRILAFKDAFGEQTFTVQTLPEDD